MSSDVYIDIYSEKTKDIEHPWKDNDDFIDSERVGHLGLMCYYDPDILACLYLMQSGNPIITGGVIEVVAGVFDGFIRLMERLKEYDNSAVVVQFGYGHPDYDDIATGNEMIEYLSSHKNKMWFVRVD
jgi:hypothetical protein